MPIEYLGEAKIFKLDFEGKVYNITLSDHDGTSVLAFEYDGMSLMLPLAVVAETIEAITKLDPMAVLTSEKASSNIEIPSDGSPPTAGELEMVSDENSEEDDGQSDGDDSQDVGQITEPASETPPAPTENVPTRRPAIKMDESKVLKSRHS